MYFDGLSFDGHFFEIQSGIPGRIIRVRRRDFSSEKAYRLALKASELNVFPYLEDEKEEIDFLNNLTADEPEALFVTEEDIVEVIKGRSPARKQRKGGYPDWVIRNARKPS